MYAVFGLNTLCDGDGEEAEPKALGAQLRLVKSTDVTLRWLEDGVA